MKEKDCYDIQTIRNYLAAVKKDPNIEVAAYYDKNGNYVIKKLVEEKDNIFTKLNPFKKKNNQAYAPIHHLK